MKSSGIQGQKAFNLALALSLERWVKRKYFYLGVSNPADILDKSLSVGYGKQAMNSLNLVNIFSRKKYMLWQVIR